MGWVGLGWVWLIYAYDVALFGVYGHVLRVVVQLVYPATIE